MSPLGRFAFYGLLGAFVDAAFTAIHTYARTGDTRLPARTSVFVFPIYGLIQPLYEPVHDALRGRASAPARAAVYGVGFLTVEYLSGAALQRLLGRAPWDYSYARWHVEGLIRPDYFPLWAAVGLALERLHDVLAGH